MKRSRSQVLYSYLPGAVFRSDERVYGRITAVEGTRLTGLNEAVIFDEIANYLQAWSEEDRHSLPLPREGRTNDYRIFRPELIKWELFPLVLECSRRACGRVRSFIRFEQLSAAPRCHRCDGRLQQLRFYSTHNCGQIKPINVPRCVTHNYDDLTFDNTGSFTTATWRCHGQGCDGAVVRRTNMSPCSCGKWPGPDQVVRMRAHTLDDPSAYRPHSIDLVNIDSSVFRSYQRHPARGAIAVGHYLGFIQSLKEGMSEADSHVGGTRLTGPQWQDKENLYRQMGLGDLEIATLRKSMGPADAGLAALSDLPAAILDNVAVLRPFYERAAVYDRSEVKRITLQEQNESIRGRGEVQQADRTGAAVALSQKMGFAEFAVTWEFPIAKVTFGYTRDRHEPNQSAITGFHHPRHNDGKYPVYAVGSTTEALLVNLSALDVLTFLVQRGEATATPVDEPAARRQILQIFADEPETPAPAATIKTLVHTLSHLLLRGLDDGQVGFAEASLAEWLVPQTLTFAVYANNLREFTLGSLWTLLNNRALGLLNAVIDRTVRCENDPLCYQQYPRSCERCCYLTFGCRLFNDDLDRQVVYDFLLHREVLGGQQRISL